MTVVRSGTTAFQTVVAVVALAGELDVPTVVVRRFAGALGNGRAPSHRPDLARFGGALRQVKSTPNRITATRMAPTATGATNRMKKCHAP